MANDAPVSSPPSAPAQARPVSMAFAWFGLALTAAYWCLHLSIPYTLGMVPIAFMIYTFGPALALLTFTIWWFTYKYRQGELLHAFIVLGAMIGGGCLVKFFGHPSMGLPLFFYGPIFALTGWAVLERATRPLAQSARFILLPLAILACWSVGLYVRSYGFDGSFNGDFAWRWSPSAEEKFIAEAAKEKVKASTTKPQETAVVELGPGDWSGFRGPTRDGRALGVKIESDWAAHPPKEVWRHAIGPGWGSVTVVGKFLYTQEQRGADECVVAYNRNTGKEIWVHNDTARFDEAIGGPGPRATPQFFEGKIFAQGASGMLNCLDAATGKLIWAKDISKDGNAKPPQWGFSSSPLIIDGVVVAVPGGAQHKGVLGYKIADGELLWSQGGNVSAERGEHTYSSPHAAVIDGIAQVLMVSDTGMYAVSPTDGKLLWNYAWLVEGMNRVVQPHEVDPNHWIIGTYYGEGSRLVEVTQKEGVFSTKEVWQTKDLKPYFNDFVSYEGHLYGFDGDIFICVDSATGKKTWKKGRYGSGQVVLLADQGLLLVMGEKGEVILLEANPKKHVELGKFTGLSGKTWNHPVLAGNQLFLRNGEEMACFELQLKP
ncbi:MAG: PQQ-binding-like beta-propeller repeat protein [Planctomycetaceae bacterium]